MLVRAFVTGTYCTVTRMLAFPKLTPRPVLCFRLCHPVMTSPVSNSLTGMVAVPRCGEPKASDSYSTSR